MTQFRVGVDIGGTFTDVVFLGRDGRVEVRKLPSTPDDFSRSVVEGLRLEIRDLEVKPGDVMEVSHGFTVATNAILEGKGAKTALITTEGFRDVLELARIRTPRLYDLYYRKPEPLVERRLRFEVKERVNYRGEVLIPLDMSEVERVVRRLLEEGVGSVAIALLHAYANPAHERRIAEYIRSKAPDLTLAVSSELLPEMREYERTSTTVINAYVRPAVETYLKHLGSRIRDMGMRVPLTVMQSNGGLSTVETAAERPIYCIESGPAAGVVGACHLGKRLGIDNIITLDMGGTTAKASIIEDGELLLAPEYEVGGSMSVGHRLLKGAGYILRVPTIDIAEVGAGGGSIAWVDRGGSLLVGPRSAGAIPGPVCYEKGGEEPTVTDANVVLGYLNPEYLLGGAFRITPKKAEEAIVEKVARPLGLSGIDAAEGVHLVANSNMGRAVRAVSSERGRDPRRFTLVVFGGGGPVHAAGLADILGITRIILPTSPGVFSAFGLLFADLEHHFVRTYFKTFDEMDLDVVNGVLEDLRREGRSLLRAEGIPESRHHLSTQVDMKYVGQTMELTVNSPIDEFFANGLVQLREAFQREHEKSYGYRSDAPCQLVNLRIIARGLGQTGRIPETIKTNSQTETRARGLRKVYFGRRHGWLDTPVAGRASLEGMERTGPLVVEEYDSTTVVPPEWKASLDPLQNIILERSQVCSESSLRSKGKNGKVESGGIMTIEQGIDPVTREIIKNYLSSVADTMAVTVVRTACSAVVKDGMDFSTAIFDAEGEQVAQGLTLPFHMGAMQPALEGVLKHFREDLRPGDIFANNDPYEGASHLPDIFLFKPVFFEETLLGYICVVAHQTDIGGRVAGGNACDNTEIYQEGLQLPPIKLFEQRVLNRAVWRIIEKNVRVPDKVLGDVLAQVAALHQGERDLLQLVSEYGLDVLKRYMSEFIDYTERLTRAEIDGLPEGSWEFTDYIDDDGINPDPIAIKVRVTICGDEMEVDFTGTSPQAKGSINPNLAFTKSAVYAVFKCLTDPNITANSGFFKPIRVIAPPGCFVNPQHPAPVAARGLGGFRITHAVFGAMAKALPKRVPAAWGGGEVGVSFGGYLASGKPFVYLEFNNDGPRGGGPFMDGADGAAAPITNMANTPIECIEADQPLLIRRYGLVPDTAGAGRYRGGLGIIREFEVQVDEAMVQIRSDRTKFLPWGTQGGRPGSRTCNILNPDTVHKVLSSKFLLRLKKGDVYRLVQAGGGGYGDPLERDPSAVLEDVRQVKITVEHAREEYGVVIHPESATVDASATEEQRKQLKAERRPLTMEPEIVTADSATIYLTEMNSK